MIRLKFNLLTKYRLEVSLVKSRKILDETPIIPPLGKVFSARKGNKISRFFRHIFEHKKINKIFGMGLVIFIFTSTLIQAPTVIGQETEIVGEVKSSLVLSTKSGVQYPVEKVRITQGYGVFHPGIDLDGITGDPIRPIMKGKVETVEYSIFGYGNTIVINHGNGVSSRYAHLSKVFVQEGLGVDIDTTIGEMGATGHATGDHLHLEIYQDGKTINPLKILPKIN